MISQLDYVLMVRGGSEHKIPEASHQVKQEFDILIKDILIIISIII